MNLTAIDLCCGAGGWQVAARGLPIRFVAAVDWAEDCCLTVRYNHPDVPVACADVTDLAYPRLRGIDLVLGAIPCEQISKARDNYRPSEAEMEQWYKLLDGVLAGVEVIGPRWWVIENVAGMRKMLPPLTPYMILDSSCWSGQKRKRIYVGRFPMPLADRAHTLLRDYLRAGPYRIGLKTLRTQERSRRRWIGQRAKRVLEAAALAPTILAFGPRHEKGFVVEMADGRERVLQFGEAAVLQGFPEDYVFVASESRAWKMVAQAIQIDTARAILEGIVAEARQEGRLAA